MEGSSRKKPRRRKRRKNEPKRIGKDGLQEGMQNARLERRKSNLEDGV